LFGAFEKMKCIFSIAPVRTLEKSRECFSLRNTHRTLVSGAPDAESEHPVQTVSGPARARHWTTGTERRPVRPVVRVRCDVRFAELSEFKSGEHRTQHGVSGDPTDLQTSQCLRPVCTGRVRCQLAQRPVLCWLPLDFDTWLTLEHRTQVLSVRCHFKSVR